MPFDQSSIIDVEPPVWDGSALHLQWSSTAPDGTYFQVYVGRMLAWYGTSRWAAITMPTSRVRVDIGAVGSGEQAVDFSGMLPLAPADRASLSWLGGSYLDPTGSDDVAGFRVFGEVTPGSGIDFTTPLVEIPAYAGGIITDGFGLGGFGQGGFGRSASSYQWTSRSLRSGTWSFAVASFDAAGNLGAPVIVSATIKAPPRSPAAFPDGTRLKASYDPTTRRVTLNWLDSPA
ncbi:hypothetical protein [Aquisphaera insulae]|uniref:hypothetical protein n=1 Tax=Aquisphaera insulae TaxID=2712864 RepID=UPI0013EC6DD2|nr:hypothetical protein [Aquisphaera insulae]